MDLFESLIGSRLTPSGGGKSEGGFYGKAQSLTDFDISSLNAIHFFGEAKEVKQNG